MSSPRKVDRGDERELLEQLAVLEVVLDRTSIIRLPGSVSALTLVRSTDHSESGLGEPTLGRRGFALGSPELDGQLTVVAADERHWRAGRGAQELGRDGSECLRV